MQKFIILALLLSACGPADQQLSQFADDQSAVATDAKGLDAMFHPVDPTLEKIATLVTGNYSRIDIAMYNMESSSQSPVVEALASPAVQRRISDGDLKVRVIFQGYDGRQGPVSQILEDELGVDVRHIVGSRDVHHKFGIFDGHKPNATLVTGSANWSLSSYSRYDENMIFAFEHPGLAQRFQKEFETLWGSTKEFNNNLAIENIAPEIAAPIEKGLAAYFNSDNFTFKPGSIKVAKGKSKKFTLTRKLVDWIDSADSSIKIASTRINLRPVYDAILRAAKRGVKIQIISNQDQYAFPHSRKSWELKSCDASSNDANETACCANVKDPATGKYTLKFDAYEKSCSTSQIHGFFLADKAYQGEGNVTVRVKLFNLNPNRQNSLSKQMHAKYTIIDEKTVLSGSFNYSVSSEYNHFENVVAIDAKYYPETVEEFIDHFEDTYEQGRHLVLNSRNGLQKRLEKAHRTKTKTPCNLETVALSYDEIDHLLTTRDRIKSELGGTTGWKSLMAACK